MSNLDKLVENFEKNVSTTIDDLKKEIASVKSALEASTGGKFVTLDSCIVQGPCSRYSVEISSSSRWTTPTWRDHVREATAALVLERARITEIHEKNLPNIEINKKVRASIVQFMKAVGVDATYSVYERPNTRSKNRQWITKNAGFNDDLLRLGSTSDHFDQSIRTLNDYEKRIQEYSQVKQREEAAIELKNKAKVQQASNLKELAVLAVKYGTAVEADEILDAILLKNKYLALGHYLLKNREDWTEGYNYAEQGLAFFNVASEEDAKIHSEITALIENWDGDGRVFRDCEYNYDRLFSIARDAPLIADYSKVVSLMDSN